MRSSGYFDAAAGVPLHPVAVEALNAALEDGWADPSRLTREARRSALLLDAAREAVATEFRVRPDEVSFLPSGAHALQAAVLGTLAGRHRSGRRLVHSAVEHSTVLATADWHAARGGEVSVIEVDSLGRVDPDRFRAEATRPGAAVAVLQAANHEVGTRQPVAELTPQLALAGVPLVVDASHDLVHGQSPEGSPVFTADARLWGGPGVGVLAIRRGTRWLPPFPTDPVAEGGRGLGVPDVPGIVAAAASLRASRQDAAADAHRLSELISQIRAVVPVTVPDSVVLGDAVDRLPHLVTFSCLYVDGEALLTELDRHGFTASSGSSCTSDSLVPSHVLVAMGALTSGNLRVSLHPGVQQADVDRFLGVLPEVVARVRAQAPGAGPRAAATGEAEVDSRGRRCPLPILDLARALPQLPIGGELTVLADDPAAASDIAAWCRLTGQQLVSSLPDDGQATRFRVRRLH